MIQPPYRKKEPAEAVSLADTQEALEAMKEIHDGPVSDVGMET